MLTYAQRTDASQISIAEIAAVVKRDRPRVTCFECERVLIPHLGTKKVWHFHHEKGADCDAASGEGLLHSEAKQHLRRELQQLIDTGGQLLSHGTCGSCRSNVVIWVVRLQQSDAVVLEKRHGERRRPDVTVLRDDRPMLFLEVVATNPCDEAKWAQVREWKLPLAEVAAENIVCLEDRAKDWRHTQPLRFRRRLGIIEIVECNPCRERREQAAVAEQRRQQEAAAAQEQRRQREAAAAADAERRAQEARALELQHLAAVQRAWELGQPSPMWSGFAPTLGPGGTLQQGVWVQAVCRGCRAPIPFDLTKPLCRNCWRRYARRR